MTPFYKVLVALRGGSQEANLLSVARHFTQEEGEICAVHVVDLPRDGLSAEEEDAQGRLISRIANRFADDLQASLEKMELGQRQAEVWVTEGRPHEEILRRAQTWNADLILVGGAAHQGLEATPLASEAMALVEASDRPVLIVADASDPANIVVPTNFDALSSRALDLGAALAASFKVPLHVVHVEPAFPSPYREMGAEEWWDTPYAGIRGDSGETTPENNDRLQEMATRVARERQILAKGHLLTGETPGQVIATFAKSLPRPLVVMGSLGRAHHRGAHLGPNARRYLRVSRLPLLTFKDEGFSARPLAPAHEPHVSISRKVKGR